MMLKKSLLSACLISVCCLAASCSLEDGIVGNYMCLDDSASAETSFSYTACNNDYTCYQIEKPKMYAETEEMYFKCFLCDVDEHGNKLKYCNAKCIGADETCDSEVCKPGTFQCDENRVLKCNDKGDFELLKTCDEAHVCNAETGRCDERGAASDCEPGVYDCKDNNLLKCNEAGKYEVDKECGELVCNAKRMSCEMQEIPETCEHDAFVCEGRFLKKCQGNQYLMEKDCGSEQLCDAVNGICRNACEDECLNEKTLLQCSEDGSIKPVTCEFSCKDNECYVPACIEGEYACNDGSLMKCVNEEFVLEEVCSRQFFCDLENNMCTRKPLDSDDDGVPDKNDICPFNPELTDDRGDYNCHPFKDGVYTIYNPYNLIDVTNILYNRLGIYNKTGLVKNNITKIVLGRDINFADYYGIIDNDENLNLITYTEQSQSCLVKKFRNFNSEFSLEFDGQGHTISAKMANGVMCSFQLVLFDSLSFGTIKNLDLNFDTIGNALLASKLEASKIVISNVSYSGSINSLDKSYVGGLIGIADVKNSGELLIENCWPKMININAPNAARVGGVVGLASSKVKFIPSNEIYRIGKIEAGGSNSVVSGIGGIFGNFGGSVERKNDSDYFKIKADSISGNGYVGGFAGELDGGSVSHVAEILGSVVSTSTEGSAGGFAGKVTLTSSVSHVGLIAELIESNSSSFRNGAGGFAGLLLLAKLEYIYVMTDKIVSNYYASGILGSGRTNYFASTTPGKMEYNYISVVNNMIEANNIASGLFTEVVYTNGACLNHISALSNLYSKKQNASGAIGNSTVSNMSLDISNMVVASSRSNNGSMRAEDAVLLATVWKSPNVTCDNDWFYDDIEGKTTSGLGADHPGLMKFKNESYESGTNKLMLESLNTSLDGNTEVQWKTTKFTLNKAYGEVEEVELPVLRIPAIDAALDEIAAAD